MATRAQKTSGRSTSGNGKGPGAGKPRTPPRRTAEQPEGEEIKDGVFVAVLRAPDQGILDTAAVGQGDVRPTEVLNILEVTVAKIRKNLGLPTIP